MDRLGGISSERGQVELLKNVENLNQRNSARRWRWRAIDVITTIGSMNDLAFLHFVLREILPRHDASAFLNGGGDLLGEFAVIEVVGIGGDALERARQLRLSENLASFVELAVALEDAPRFRKLREMRVAEVARILPREFVA